MFSTTINQNAESSLSEVKEGDLFKRIELDGEIFEIRYGFYEACDRLNRFAEPIPLYPDFTRYPCYSKAGVPFATEMQPPCEHFVGQCDADSVCGDCEFYRHGDELLGQCICPHNQREPERRESCKYGNDEAG